MTAPTVEGARPKWLGRYLRDGERGVVVTRRHGVVILEPWLSVLVGFAIVVVLVVRLPAGEGVAALVNVLWWLWFVLVARALAITLDWRRTWFVATNKRLLLVHGFIIRKVAMMPLKKVTDMTYGRSVLGRILGYGTFLLESAGQDQALRMMDHIPDPDTAYRSIIAEIFPADTAAQKRDQEERDEDADPRAARSWSSDGSWGAWPDAPVAQRGGPAQRPAGDTDRLPRTDLSEETLQFARLGRTGRAGRVGRAPETPGGRRGGADTPADDGNLWERMRRACGRLARKARLTLLDPAPEPYRGTAPGQFVVRQGAGRAAVVHSAGHGGAAKPSEGKSLVGTVVLRGGVGPGRSDDGETLYSSSDRPSDPGDSLSNDGEVRDGPTDALGERSR